MDARIGRGAALGVAVTLALALLLTLLWGIGSARTAKADNLDVCPSGCPYTTIQDAVHAAEDGDTVRVAAGTYTGSMTCDILGLGTYTSTLCITEDIALLGGYNPADFTVRDPDVYRTTVTWLGDPGHSIIILTNGTAAVVDGFELTGAEGATALWARDAAATVSHNRIVNNETGWWGSGMFVSGSSAPTIESNTILSNTAQTGGGIVVRGGATAVISGNLIAYNAAITDGGGLYVEGSMVTVTNNTFLSNTAANNGGGGFLAQNGSAFVMSGNTFHGNSAGCCGGGMAAWWDTTGKIEENTFTDNDASNWLGGGIVLVSGSFDVLSNTIVGNHAPGQGAGGVGVTGDNTYITLSHNKILSNTATGQGAGGVMIMWGPRAIVQSNEIRGNVSYDWGATGLHINSAEVLVDSNLIAENIREAWIHGDGAIWVEMASGSRPVTITNNVIVDNADKGIGIWEDGVFDVRIVNNTIARNRNEGVLLWGASVVPLLRNNIIAANGYCGVAADEGAQYQTIDYNDVWNNGGGSGNYCDYGNAAVPPAPGSGSISVDPQFVDAVAGDYHLAWGSPARNAGTNAGAPAHDKDGVPRPQMGVVDMGAYERTGFRMFLPSLSRAYNIGQIAFTSDEDGYGSLHEPEIWVMNPDGTAQTRLTYSPWQGGSREPAWSPDGQKIAFCAYRSETIGSYEIYVMNADGTNRVRLTENPASSFAPDWSPDGTKIVFEAYIPGGTSEIFVINADGTGQTQLTDTQAGEREPTWSPDGSQIAFYSSRDGNTEIYVMDPDGANPTRLTDNSAGDFDPAWSPDGTRIAFSSLRDGNCEIYVMNADGTGQTRATNSSACDYGPAWSPDGKRIAFASDTDWYNSLYEPEIWVMNADGTDLTQLTDDPAADFGPAWRP